MCLVVLSDSSTSLSDVIKYQLTNFAVETVRAVCKILQPFDSIAYLIQVFFLMIEKLLA